MTDISKDDLFAALKAETAEVERLRAINVELLAALERLAGQVGPVGAADHAYGAWVHACSVITKAKGGAA